MTTTTDRYVVLTFKVHEEDGQYVSHCVELDVASCGDSIGEAYEAVLDATMLYLDVLEEQGQVERVLMERGVRIIAGRPPGVRPNGRWGAHDHDDRSTRQAADPTGHTAEHSDAG